MLSHLSLGINCFLPHGFEISISHEAFKSLKHPARNALSILLHLINLSKISKNLNYEFFNFLKPPVTILNFGQNKAIFLSILVPNTIITCLVNTKRDSCWLLDLFMGLEEGGVMFLL